MTEGSGLRAVNVETEDYLGECCSGAAGCTGVAMVVFSRYSRYYSLYRVMTCMIFNMMIAPPHPPKIIMSTTCRSMHRRNNNNKCVCSASCILEFYKGKRIILTGASRGIGKHLAIQLAQLEAKYALSALSFSLSDFSTITHKTQINNLMVAI